MVVYATAMRGDLAGGSCGGVEWDGRGVFRVVFGSVMGNARLHVDVAGEFELGSREELGLDVTLTSAWCVLYCTVRQGANTSLTTDFSM